MKKLYNILFSSIFTLILLLILAVSIGTATFIEERYDTVTAHLLVYDTLWFEVILALLVLNFIGNIGKYKLWRKEKRSLLVFHLAFIVIIIGAGITRFVGFEGNMHIREGESSNVIYSSQPYLMIKATGSGIDYNYDRPVNFSESIGNAFKVKVDGGSKGEVVIRHKDYFKNAVEKIRETGSGGETILQFLVGDDQGKIMVFVKKGEVKDFGKVSIGFDNFSQPDAIILTERADGLYISSSTGLIRQIMHGKSDSSVDNKLPAPSDSSFLFDKQYLFETKGVFLLFNQLYKNAVKEIVPAGDGESGSEVLIAEISYNGKKKDVVVPVSMGFNTVTEKASIDGLEVTIGYGTKAFELPFSLFLDNFNLERYPGSMSPSSYASDVTLLDDRKNLKEKHSIYMNHVLDYGGYRFFQSSYDMDEKGTILSVNHDFWGTWVTYIGYILLGLGFALSLLNNRSRFRFLQQSITRIRNNRKSSIAALLFLSLGLSAPVFSQNSIKNPVSKDQSEKFGHLVVQTFDGRFEPVHTMASDVMLKLSRKDHFETAKGDMDAMQVFLDMLIDPVFWKQQKIILIKEKSIQDILGVQGKYASFSDFIGPENTYKLSEYSENAFRKTPGKRTVFDKEILKVDERINIWISLLNGSILRLFPQMTGSDTQWLSLSDSMAYVPFTGSSLDKSRELQIPVPNYSSTLRTYLGTVYEATVSGDYAQCDKVLSFISALQQEGTTRDLLPTASRIEMEINYNKSNPFILLRNVYGMLSLVLLLLAFIDNLSTKKKKLINYTLYFFIALLGVAFLYHTYGMGMRWYLSKHAPWSNGYEALLLIAWATLLAGFTFIRNSKITIAATALLAFSILMTASHSSYDPELTNLQPVLKSYWLVIHVAIITISYGFLALGFILGIINLLLILFKSKKDPFRTDSLVEELTCTNEVALTVGLFMATIGTFLGGVWANESWGRYWGWDAKETWALVIVITYAFVLHIRLVPKLKSLVLFNAASVIAFGSVIMTFVGVNYYLSKGLHSYAADDRSVFPLWGWMFIGLLLLLIVSAWIKSKTVKR